MTRPVEKTFMRRRMTEAFFLTRSAGMMALVESISC